MTKTAIILAAGSANRLMPLSKHRPKCMVLLAGKPVIQHVLETVASIGVERAIVVVASDDAMIRSFIGDGEAFGLDVTYVLQDGSGGSAAALRLVDPALFQDETEFFVFPANLFLDASTVAALPSTAADTTLFARATADHRQAVPVVKGDRVLSVSSEVPVVGSTRVTTGIHHLSTTFLAFLREKASNESFLDIALGKYAVDHSVHARDVDGVWEPLVDPWDLVRVNEHALKGQEVCLGENVDVHESAVLVPPVWIGAGTHIGENTVVGPNVAVGVNCRIGPLCEVRDAILNDNVDLDTRSVLRGAVLDDGCRIGPGFLAPDGCVVGADATIGSGVIFEGPQCIDAGQDTPSGTVIGAS